MARGMYPNRIVRVEPYGDKVIAITSGREFVTLSGVAPAIGESVDKYRSYQVRSYQFTGIVVEGPDRARTALQQAGEP